MTFQPKLRLQQSEPLTWQDLDNNLQGLADAVNTAGLPFFNSFAETLTADLSTLSVIRTKGYYAGSAVGAGAYVKTLINGTAGETDGGSYFNDIDGNRWELIHNGTVYLEQFGVVPDTVAGTRISTCVNAVGVKTVTTNLDSIKMDRICKIDKSNILLDFNGAQISWEANYNPYYVEYGLGTSEGGATDRTIGVFSARGSVDTSTTYTVAGAVSEGQSDLTVDTVAGLSVGDYILMTVVYPRRTSNLPAKVLQINGLVVSIDYSFGYDADSVTFQKANMLENIVVRNANITNNSPTGMVDSHLVAGVGFHLCANASAEAVNLTAGDYPNCITQDCWNPRFTKITTTDPRDVTAGRGYCVQFNTSQPFYAADLVSFNARHIFDSSHGQYGVVERCKAYEQRSEGIFQYTTHGEYEHDIVLRDCNHFNGRVSLALARSGRNFGSFSKRIRVEGGSYSGLFFVSYCEDFHAQDADLKCVDPTLHELSSAGISTYDRVKFANPIRVEKDQGEDANVYPQILAKFTDCDFGSNYIRSTYQEGAIEVETCRNLSYIDRSPADPEFTPAEPKYVKISRTPVTLNGSWQIRASDYILFEDCDITLGASANFGQTSKKLEVVGGTLTQDAASQFIWTSQAEKSLLEDVDVTNGANFRVFGSTKVFVMRSVRASLPRAATTTSQFTAESTTDCRCYVDNCDIQFTSVDGSAHSIGTQFTGNTGLSWKISNSYIEGTMNIALNPTQVVSLEYSNVTAPQAGIFKDTRYSTASTGTTIVGAGGRDTMITFSVANALTAVAGLPIGYKLKVARSAAITVTFTAPAGETLRGSGILNTDNVMTLEKVSSTVWQSSQ